MPEPHERLDEAMSRRRLELRMNWRDIAKRAGITYEALRAIRRGESRPTDLTAAALDEAFRWLPGSVQAILDGGDPIPIEAQTAQQPPQRTPAFSPSEALRRVVRSSAKELGVTPEGVEEALRLARRDLGIEEPPPEATEPQSGRTDLSDFVREHRLSAGLSLEAVAADAVDRASGDHVIDVDWLDRLERAALDPSEYPEYPQLDALVDALNLDPAEVQERAGAQFMGVRTVWSEDGQVRAIVHGELSGEDLAKVQNLMRLYRRAPRS